MLLRLLITPENLDYWINSKIVLSLWQSYLKRRKMEQTKVVCPLLYRSTLVKC